MGGERWRVLTRMIDFDDNDRLKRQELLGVEVVCPAESLSRMV